MAIEVYTLLPTPFGFGRKYAYIKTEIEEFERIDIGAGYYGILFKNEPKNLWHMAQEDCGALIGTNKSRAALIKQVKGDVASGTPEIFEEQIKQGKDQMSQAMFLERDEWFSYFHREEK